MNEKHDTIKPQCLSTISFIYDVPRFISCAGLEGVTMWRRCEPKGENGPREVGGFEMSA